MKAKPKKPRPKPYALLLALAFGLAAGVATADDSPVPAKPKPKPKAIRKVVLKDPTPQCLWTPEKPEPCNCYFLRPGFPMDGGPKWAWRDCFPRDEPEILPAPSLPTFQELEQPVLVPTPLPSPPSEDELKLGLQAWSLAGFSGSADRVTYGGRILADGPIANTFGKPLRMFVRLDLSTLPGVAFNVTNVETFGQSAELHGGLYRRLAESRPEGQRVTTSVVLWGGFATIRDSKIADRYLRSVGLGLRLAEETGGAELIVGWCRDEAAGYIGAGQICVSGSVPLVGTSGAVVLGGNAVLNLSRASVTPQRDILRVFVGISLGDALSAITRRRP